MAGVRDFLRHHWIILLVLLIAAAVRAALISRPFVGNQAGTAAGIPLCVARNYLRYGPVASRFAGVMNTGAVPPNLWAIYSHHPPLVPLLVSGVYRLAGINEATSRFTSACFALANSVLLYAMGRRYFDARVSVIAAILYSFCPATIAFGDMPDYLNVQLVFFILLCVFFYARWREANSTLSLAGLAVAFTLGALTDWPIFYLVPLVGLHSLIKAGRRGAVQFVPFALVALIIFAALGWWMSWAGGDVSIFHQIGVRVAGKLNDKVPITPGVWLRLVVHRDMALLQTYPVFLLALLYVGGAVADRSRRHLVPLLLLGVAAIHSIVAIQANVQHTFWSVLFTPGLCFAGAVACSWLMVRPVVAAPILIAFVAISIAETRQRITAQYPHLANVPYSQKQLGSLIHSISRPDEGVMTSDSFMEPELWFYADRQLATSITTGARFDEALAEPRYILPFSYVQHGGPTPHWFVMPRIDRGSSSELASMLDARFPRRQLEQFDIYDLTQHVP